MKQKNKAKNFLTARDAFGDWNVFVIETLFSLSTKSPLGFHGTRMFGLGLLIQHHQFMHLQINQGGKEHLIAIYASNFRENRRDWP